MMASLVKEKIVLVQARTALKKVLALDLRALCLHHLNITSDIEVSGTSKAKTKTYRAVASSHLPFLRLAVVNLFAGSCVSPL